MNTSSGVSSPLALARSDTALALSSPDSDWPGLALASAAIGVPLAGEAIARFNRYRDLLLERSARFNLTAIQEPREIERRLFLDALAMVPALDRTIDARTIRADRPLRLVDVGTGAGFPGLALKIVRPMLDVTLIDATAKKVTFLRDVIAALNLGSVRAIHGRAEELGQNPAYRAQFDIATARAVASLPVLLEYVIPLLKIGGTALLPKGLKIDEEVRAGEHAASRLGATIVSVEALANDATRLLTAAKMSATPAAYPRRVGMPSHDPLGERS